jgi:hypothetical protein
MPPRQSIAGLRKKAGSSLVAPNGFKSGRSASGSKKDFTLEESKISEFPIFLLKRIDLREGVNVMNPTGAR